MMFGQVLGGAIGGVWQTFAVITFIFAVLERTKANINFDSDFSSLPTVPKKSEQIKPYEPIIGIFFSIAAAILFLGVPQIMGFHRTSGEWITLFDVSVLRNLWFPIILWTVSGIAAESVALIDGRYTKRLAIVTVTANLFAISCAAIVFLNSNIVNREFSESIINEFGFTDEINYFTANAHVVLFIIICAALILEAVTVSMKAWKYAKV
jgi:hypothetical protein